MSLLRAFEDAAEHVLHDDVVHERVRRRFETHYRGVQSLAFSRVVLLRELLVFDWDPVSLSVCDRCYERIDEHAKDLGGGPLVMSGVTTTLRSFAVTVLLRTVVGKFVGAPIHGASHAQFIVYVTF